MGKYFVGKAIRKMTSVSSRRGREDNIQVERRELRCRDVGGIRLAQDKEHWRDLVTVNFRIP
jgi:hypothetical protein